MKPRIENPQQETHTEYLQRKRKIIGHYAIARWMMKQGYPFRYAYFVCFGRMPKEAHRAI